MSKMCITTKYHYDPIMISGNKKLMMKVQLDYCLPLVSVPSFRFKSNFKSLVIIMNSKTTKILTKIIEI